MRLLFLLSCSVFLSLQLFAQTGDKFFSQKDYKSAAVAYEREAATKPELYFKMGKALFAQQRFEEAIVAFELYKEKYTSADKATADKWIEALKHKDDIIIVKNIGAPINSSYGEAIPRISSDGNTLFFKGVSLPGGFGGEDIWYSKKQPDGSWGAPQNFKDLNTENSEALYSISSDGNVAILFGNYVGSFGGGDLFYSVKTADGWTSPCNLGGAINTKDWEAQAALGPDGKTLFFCSSRDGSLGSEDIYVTKLTDKGWSKPVNLGNVVNTSGRELRPTMASDGKTLYFSSTGHFGFGGTDIFMTKRLDDTYTNWTTPVNLGKYINTLEDDEDIAIPSSGTKAYTVKNDMLDGYGKTDIYEFVLPMDKRPEQVLTVYGTVKNEKDSAVSVTIKYIDMATNTLVSKITTSLDSGTYKTTLPLFKKYLVEINTKGYLYFSEELDLTDPTKYMEKQSIKMKFGNRLERMQVLRNQLEDYNKQLQALINSESSEIRESFDAYDKLNKQFDEATDELKKLVLESKLDWMAEENLLKDLERNYKVQTASVGTTFELKNIFFDLGKATLRQESMVELDKLYDIMLKNKIAIELGGHTDSIGSDEANLSLSQERVNSVRSYLTQKGIEANRIAAVGYGEAQPIASNSTDEGRQKNRRVEVKITETQYRRVGEEVADATQDVNYKAKEGDKNEIFIETIKEDFDLLATLQTAARNGGLPSGSECGKTVTYLNTGTYASTGSSSSKKSSSSSFNFGDKEKIDLEDNIYKRFSIGLENFAYKGFGYDNAAYMQFTNKRLRESTYSVYLPQLQSNRYGYGYSHIYAWQLKQYTGLPLNIMWGAEFKVFQFPSFVGATDSSFVGHINLPIGLRYVKEIAGFHIAPEITYSYGLGTNNPFLYNSAVLSNSRGITSHIRVGGQVRWKFITGGAFVNIGNTVNYLGLRAGLSL